MEMAGCDRAIAAVAACTSRNAAYSTENWKTLLDFSVSFCGFNLEKAGNSTVAVGVVKLAGGGNSLSIWARLDGLQSGKEIQWFTSTIFEKWSGSELITSEFDNAPDEDFQRTVPKET